MERMIETKWIGVIHARCGFFQESGSRIAAAVKSTFWIALERMIETKELSFFSSVQ